MPPKNITDVFFDLDHTLWDFDKNSALAFKRVFSKHNINLSLDDFLPVYEPINLEYWRKFREDRVSKLELRRGRLTDAFDKFNLIFETETIDAIAQTYIDELPGDNHLFSDAISVLDYLSTRYKLHIITNGFEEVQHLKLLNSGIKKYFSTVTTSEETGIKKPHPTIFESALAKASASSVNSMMIGDSFEADIIGAQNVGMHTLFFNYRKQRVPESYLGIYKLSEIKQYL